MASRSRRAWTRRFIVGRVGTRDQQDRFVIRLITCPSACPSSSSSIVEVRMQTAEKRRGEHRRVDLDLDRVLVAVCGGVLLREAPQRRGSSLHPRAFPGGAHSSVGWVPSDPLPVWFGPKEKLPAG